MFKPITEIQKDTKESLVSELKPIKESLKELPAITFPQLQAIEASSPEEDEEEEEEGVMRVGKILEMVSKTVVLEVAVAVTQKPMDTGVFGRRLVV